MNILKKLTLAVAFLISVGASATAGATAFTVTSGGFTVGSGYGTANGQLDVEFNSLVTPQSFTLGVGDTASFVFGRATLKEACINTGVSLADVLLGCGIGGNELDNLGVTAWLTFTNPLAETVYNVAVTGALAGPVNSPVSIFELTDYWINFSPVVVGFGGTGSFVVDMGDLFFDKTGTITNGYNVTLTAVPEPASLAILGLGLLGIAAARRRKQ